MRVLPLGERLGESTVFISEHDPARCRPVLGAVLGRERALMVDSGASAAHAAEFISSLRRAASLPEGWMPGLVALTHWHWDHSFGLSSLGLPCWAHERCAGHLAALAGLGWDEAQVRARVEAGTELPFTASMIAAEYGSGRDIRVALPDRLFQRAAPLALGGLSVELMHIDSDHSDDTAIVLVPPARAVFLGDITGPAWHEKPVRYRADRVLALFDALEALPADLYIESHEAPACRAGFLARYAMLRSAARAFTSGAREREALALAARKDAPAAMGAQAAARESRRIASLLLAGESLA